MNRSITYPNPRRRSQAANLAYYIRFRHGGKLCLTTTAYRAILMDLGLERHETDKAADDLVACGRAVIRRIGGDWLLDVVDGGSDER